MPPKRTRPRKPQILNPVDYNVGGTGDLYRVFAVPLVPSAVPGHPFVGKPRFEVTSFVESLSWQSSKDEGGVVTGSLQLRNPANILGILVPGSRLQILQATQLVTGAARSAAAQRRYVKVLEMIVQSRDKQQVESIVQLDCADRSFYLTQGKHDFNFKPKKGKRGKTASEIIIRVCTDEKIPFQKRNAARKIAGSIPRTTLPLEKISGHNTTILQFFVDVLKAHNKRADKANGKRPAPPNWDINMRLGYLTVAPIKPPRSAWLIDERAFMSEPSYQESLKDVATRVTVKGKNTTYHTRLNKDGTVSKRKKAVKSPTEVTVDDPAMIRAYGLIHHIEKVSGHLTPERARHIAHALLAKMSRLQRTLQFNCPALPGIWVGSKVYLHCPTYGMKGLFTVTVIQYTVNGPDGAMMSVTVDAGSRPITQDAVPDITPVASARILDRHRGTVKGVAQTIPAGRTVRVMWADKTHLDHTHPQLFRVHHVEILHSADVSLQDLGTKGETVVIHYANGRTYVVANKFKFPPGLTATTDEGYLPNAQVTG